MQNLNAAPFALSMQGDLLAFEILSFSSFRPKLAVEFNTLAHTSNLLLTSLSQHHFSPNVTPLWIC